MGRLRTQTDALEHATGWEYDALGRVTRVTDANGQVSERSYDAAKRARHRRWTTWRTGQGVTFGYDPLGRRTAVTDTLGVTRFAYDPLGRLERVTYPDQAPVGYTYDAASNRTALAYPDGRSVSYAYDPANRLSAVTDGQGEVASYGYQGRRLVGVPARVAGWRRPTATTTRTA